MALWLKDQSSTPKEGWQYPAVAGAPITTGSFSQLHGAVKKHYEVNGREAPTPEAVLLWVCENLSVPCYDGQTPFVNRYTNPPSYAERGLKSPDWPLLLRPLKLLAQPGDRGLGSIIARTIGPYGGEAWKVWYKGVFGRDCGCGDRADTLDIEFPL